MDDQYRLIYACWINCCWFCCWNLAPYGCIHCRWHFGQQIIRNVGSTSEPTSTWCKDPNRKIASTLNHRECLTSVNQAPLHILKEPSFLHLTDSKKERKLSWLIKFILCNYFITRIKDTFPYSLVWSLMNNARGTCPLSLVYKHRQITIRRRKLKFTGLKLHNVRLLISVVDFYPRRSRC
jgi:hypothetical protein